MTSRVMFLDCSIGWGHLRLVRLFFFFFNERVPFVLSSLETNSLFFSSS